VNGVVVTKQTTGKSRASQKTQAQPWIYNPWLDLMVGCGAWSAPLLLVSYFSLSSSTRMWSVVFYALALFFNYPHYMATLYRAYHRSEEFEKYRIFTVHITALVLLTLLLAHSWARLLPWIFTIYLTWSPWHYSGQNYGLFMMFARRAGADPDRKTLGALYGAFIVSYLVLFLSFHTGPSTDPLFLSLGIPAVVSRAEQIALGIAFVILSFYGLRRLAGQTGWRPLLPSVTLFSSQILWFLVPALVSLVKGLQVPQNRYSTGILAVMHSAQYLWITSYYARREAADGDTATRSWRPLAYFGVLVLGGIALFVPGPWLASRAFHRDYTASFLIFTSLVNIHHFILDGAIWKLRDGRIAALLLNSRDRIAGAASRTGGQIDSIWQWLKGTGGPSRTVRVGGIALLLLWGSLDQARYYLALHTDDLRDLRRAASLNSFDSALQLRLARKEVDDGETKQAEAALRRAVQVNPVDPIARQSLLKFLIQQKRFDDAFQATDDALKYFPGDSNLLVDRGLLDAQRGRPNAARADWDRALILDPKQWLPHLYLAQELDREGEFRAAATHYAVFLEKIAQQKPADRPAADLMIGIVMRMAECQARSRQPDLAIKSYQMAAKLAAQNTSPKLESVANVNEAELQAKAGKTSEALRLYQRALQLDEMVGDDQASSLDWFAYGRFLAQSGFAPSLAYASIAKAEFLQQSLKRSVLPPTEASDRKQVEDRLNPTEAASIRQNMDPLLQQAMKVQP
jgi:tetratricopeptide (TPR) repeat protein